MCLHSQMKYRYDKQDFIQSQLGIADYVLYLLVAHVTIWNQQAVAYQRTSAEHHSCRKFPPPPATEDMVAQMLKRSGKQT
jgi:hypothetical protein